MNRHLLTAALMLTAASQLGSENVTLSTYYPAPSGVYTQMLTTQNTYLARDSGNVGIGTASASAKLEVAGTGKVTGTLSVGGFQMAAGAQPNYVLTSDGAGTASWQASSSLPTDYSKLTGYAMPGANCGAFTWTPLKFLGKNRMCIAYMTAHMHNPGGSCGRYEDNGCRYNPASGALEGAASSGTTYCGYVCFN